MISIRDQVNYVILALAVITLVVSSYFVTIASTIIPEINIPEDAATKEDLRELATKEDVSGLLTKDDLKLVATEASVSELTGTIEELTGTIEEVKTDVETKVDLIEETLEVDRNIGGIISGLRDDEEAVIVATRFEWDPSGHEMIKLDSRTIESGNGWWEIHYLTPGMYELICTASDYVSYPKSYLAIIVPDDDLPWSITRYEFTLYLPNEAPAIIPSVDIPDRSVGGLISGLGEGDYITITVSSTKKVYRATSGNGWWRINVPGHDYYTIKADASGYTASPESYEDVIVPNPLMVKVDWTRMDLNFTMSPLNRWQIEHAQYMDMFQEQPELFSNRTKILQVLFENDGEVVGNLTYVLRFTHV